MDLPSHLRPFVLPVESVVPHRRGMIDLYPPQSTEPSPAVVIVHGGPVPADLTPKPRGWPLYRGYACLAAMHGVVGVTVDLRLPDLADYSLAATDLRAAVDSARAEPLVDADRVALWFFSGGGLLLADWLPHAPPWLRCVAASYPLLGPLPDETVDPTFRPVEALTASGMPPIVLTRVGRERPAIAATVEPFVSQARARGARLTIVDVPEGRHGFDVLDDTDESRAAINRAFGAVLAALI